MSFFVKGQIVQVLPVQQGVSQRGNNWRRVSYILEHESGQYPKRIVFDVRDAKIEELNIQLGEWVTIHCNCDAREYPQGSGKYFNSIDAWKVERQAQQQNVSAPASVSTQYSQQQVSVGHQPAPQPAALQPATQQQAQQQAQQSPLPFPPAQ